MKSLLSLFICLGMFYSSTSYGVYLKYLDDNIIEVKVEEWTDQKISKEKNLRRLIFKAKSYCPEKTRSIASVKAKVVDYWVEKKDGSDYLKPIMQVKLRCILP